MIGLPTLEQLDASSTLRIWLCAQPADMRCGFDRLAELASLVTGEDPLSGHLFLFRARSRHKGVASRSVRKSCWEATPL